MSDLEPRRSVRATKGQHTKAFDELGNGPEPKKQRQGKKGGKKSTHKEEAQEEDEEVIRCICGATTQDDDDANEPWIACDKCGAWQHNVCMGMSVFTEDLTKDYFCEQCAPEDHKTTLEAMAKGERPWEARRQKYEDEKKKKKGKKAKGKRTSDGKEKERDRASPGANSVTNKTKSSPTPDLKKEETPQETPAVKGKRKSRDHSQGPQTKLRKGSDGQPVPAPTHPPYTLPPDLPDSISKLESIRQQKAKAILKSLDVAIDQAEKRGAYTVPTDTTKKAITERLAIEIERAFHDSHANNPGAAAQLRTLVFNLKGNIDLAAQLFNKTLPPPSFVIMTGEELANKELQRENAEMKARAEKQSILIQDDGPRMRRTHKGEEVVEGDDYATAMEEAPSALRRQSTIDDEGDQSPVQKERSTSATPLRVDTKVPQTSPKIDIGKVFSTVRSPSVSHQRRQSTHIPSAGPGEDPDVDRLLEDGNDSPPYSPTEEIDPDVIWRGSFLMTNIADMPMVAKHVGGADLKKAKGIEWNDLVPNVLTVAGRIPEDKAVPYLCSMRWNNQVDLIITSLTPAKAADEASKKQFGDVINYFKSKKRYGVVGERKLGNVRDTYLIPIPEGNGPLPEPMQNIGDHQIPLDRSEPMLLMIFVFRDEKQTQIPVDQQKMEMQQTSPEQTTPAPQRTTHAPTPSYSPATPNAPNTSSGFHPPPQYSQTPIPPPTIPGQPPPPMPQRQAPPAAPPVNQDPNAAAMRAAQAEGERKARQVLGPLFASATVTFLLPHAARMKEGEWNAVKRCLERDPRARDDLPLLSKLLTEEGNNARQAGQQQPPPAAAPVVVQKTIAAVAGNTPASGPQQPPQPKA